MKFSLGSSLPRLTLFAVISASLTAAMKFEDFKKCSQSGFCRRNRGYADIATVDTSPYTLLSDSIVLTDNNNKLYADIKNTETDVLLTLDLHILEDNTARVRINEKAPIKPRYDEHNQYTIAQDPKLASTTTAVDKQKDALVLELDESRKIIIHSHPVQIQFFMDNEPVISLNDRGFFNFEHLHTKETHQTRKQLDNGQDHPLEDGLWEETFKTWTDPKPNGPESIALDVTFHGFSHVYGIPEHASSFALKETRGGKNAYEEPYRLYNTDVFEYALDSPTSLYGAVPFMIAHKKNRSVGIFWNNPSETWIDIVKSKANAAKSTFQKVMGKEEQESTQTHWMSEAGVLDLYVFFGPSSKQVIQQYTQLTGAPAMPQMFAIGYHQCRWNYINQKDVLDVDSKFDEFDMPYDVIWLDIEYTEEKKYFTWDSPKFPNPIEMQETLDDKGRKMVVIIDPHIKRADNYYISDEAKAQDMFVKKPDGNDYEAWCWPGQSSWTDFVKKEAYNWWKKQFSFEKFKGTRENVHLWNDMNEPSVFNGPEITMQKEMVHDSGRWEHRVLHNMYALLSHSATADGVRERTEVQKRPFVLTRGYYAGVQRVGPIWTGDNEANWEALKYSNPMLLSNSMAGVVFSGADVPGFFGNPSPELLTRWYQAAVYQPFFRGHAHIDTKRREPYLSEEPYRSIVRNALRERYALLSYWYTLFYEAYKTSVPMMRPMVLEFPEDENVFTLEDQFMVGESILVKPITMDHGVGTEVYFPGQEPWYHTQTYKVYADGNRHVQAAIDSTPAFYQGGRIIPRRERARRSSTAMRLDPFTLVIAKGRQGQAKGTLYMDDEETYSFQDGAYTYTEFSFDNNQLVCKNLHQDPTSDKATKFAKTIEKVRIERLTILGQATQPKGVKVVTPNGTTEAEFSFDKEKQVVTVKDPKVSATVCDWSIAVY